jgi:serine protease Do
VRTQSQARSGSGFIYGREGLVLTNRHVVADADRVVVRLHDGREYEAAILGTDAATDVAVLRITAPAGAEFPTLRLGDSNLVEVGDWVLALGSPLQLDFSVTAGIVSAKGRSIRILADESEAPQEAFLQTDAAINAGNSGGPLVDAVGRVVGMNSAIESPTGVFAGYGFAVPINIARRWHGTLSPVVSSIEHDSAPSSATPMRPMCKLFGFLRLPVPWSGRSNRTARPPAPVFGPET